MRTGTLRRRTALLAPLALAAGCGAGGGSGAIPDRTVAPRPTQSVPRATPDAPEPTRIELPTLGVTAPMMNLGLTQSGKLEVPPGAERAGWYTGSPAPGATGPAIIAAHINWAGDPGPFSELGELQSGDRVRVTLADGSVTTFRISGVEQYPKDEFPTRKVYSDLSYAGVRLISCGGDFVESVDSYEDNIVAYGRLVDRSSA